MNHHSIYGEFYYSEESLREDLKEQCNYTDEEIDEDFEVLAVEEIDEDQYKVESIDETLSWEDIEVRYGNPTAICDPTDSGPVISHIVVNK